MHTEDSRLTALRIARRHEDEAKARAPNYRTDHVQAARLLLLLNALPGSETNTQAERVRVALEGGPCSTIELSRHLDVLHPAARIKALRDRGLTIVATWVKQETMPGAAHRVALYTLTDGAAG